MKIYTTICDKCYHSKHKEIPATFRRGFKRGFKADICEEHAKVEKFKTEQEFFNWIYE